MQTDMQRFANRFEPLFADKGLVNIKFFVRDADGCSLPTLVQEATAIQDMIAAGEVVDVEDVDAGCKTRRFDDAF